jgi:hypothetical protein
MQSIGRSMIGMMLATGLLTVGCASTKLSNRQEYQGEKLARPDRIFVHDFAASAADLPAWSEAATTYAGREAAASPEELAAARKLGTHMTTELVSRIDAMGLEAERADGGTKPSPGDLVIVGFLGSVDEGSGFKRVVIGFGSGSAEVTSHVEGYLATADGYRKLGSGDASAGKGHSPGVVLPIAVTIATANPIGLIVMAPIKVGTEVSGRNKIEGVGKRMAGDVADELEKKFREQGWIER